MSLRPLDTQKQLAAVVFGKAALQLQIQLMGNLMLGNAMVLILKYGPPLAPFKKENAIFEMIHRARILILVPMRVAPPIL